jgi:hemolysin III
LFPLIYYSLHSGDVFKITGTSIYGICLVLLFTCSTLYHSSSGEKRNVLQKVDHISIFLLISGTYTPYTLVTLRESSGIYLLITIWTISFFGIIFKFFLAHKFDFLSTLLYLFCGWLIVFDFQNFHKLFNGNGFYWLGAGGIAYTVGAVFYLLEKIPKNHEIWHVFVMLGGLFHYISILFYVI